MKTWERICIHDHLVAAQNGDQLNLKRGEKYLTSEEEDGKVTVFSTFWVKVPTSIFAGEEVFTEA